MSIFGTDGIRGKYGVFPIDCKTFFKIGLAISNVFGSYSKTVLIARDTRISSIDLENALVCGLNYGGMQVISIGILPTAAISFFISNIGAVVGLMISASHNVYSDNGLKFFSSDGYKLSRDYEKLIEAQLIKLHSMEFSAGCFYDNKRFLYLEQAKHEYINYIIATIPVDSSINNIKVVLDVANGVSTYVAAELFRALNVTVFVYNDSPNGENINKDCGAIFPYNIQSYILKHSADIGICLDGDGDRVVICDERGNVIDGDQLIGGLALLFLKNGLLDNPNIVSTVMSSRALDNFLFSKGMNLIKADVGEHNVIDAMNKCNAVFGAENSGHFILNPYTKTSDGLLVALQILRFMALEGKSVSALFNNFVSPIRVFKNIYCEYEVAHEVLEKIKERFSCMKDLFLVIRKSGTEKGIIRVLLEGNNLNVLNQIIDVIESALCTMQN